MLAPCYPTRCETPPDEIVPAALRQPTRSRSPPRTQTRSMRSANTTHAHTHRKHRHRAPPRGRPAVRLVRPSPHKVGGDHLPILAAGRAQGGVGCPPLSPVHNHTPPLSPVHNHTCTCPASSASLTSCARPTMCLTSSLDSHSAHTARQKHRDSPRTPCRWAQLR